MVVIEFSVPGEPVAKGRPRFTRTGFAYTDKKTERYESLVRSAYLDKYADRKPAEGPVLVEIKAYFPPLKSWSKKKREQMQESGLPKVTKPDLDNLIKVIDGLNKVAWMDDSQICLIQAYKGYSDQPRMDFKIYIEEESE